MLLQEHTITEAIREPTLKVPDSSIKMSGKFCLEYIYKMANITQIIYRNWLSKLKDSFQIRDTII